jgi:hypothetical protein
VAPISRAAIFDDEVGAMLIEKMNLRLLTRSARLIAPCFYGLRKQIRYRSPPPRARPGQREMPQSGPGTDISSRNNAALHDHLIGEGTLCSIANATRKMSLWVHRALTAHDQPAFLTAGTGIPAILRFTEPRKFQLVK